MITDPFAPILERQGFVVLDGGLATTLEAAGHVLHDTLWSAKLIDTDPAAIGSVHRAFLEAGADCVVTSAYQASLPGFAAAGYDEADAERLLVRSTELAREAREAVGRSALVAASVGPYGAYLADGSEYDGRYGVSDDDLARFHRHRLRLLATSGADLLACETVPSIVEVRVLLDLLDEASGDIGAWVSVSCRDGQSLNDGTPIEEAVAACARRERVVAVGVNCTAPDHVPELIRRAVDATDLPVLAYPNSGEAYDAASGRWSEPDRGRDPWLDAVLAARDAGARILGGCCRIGPDEIAELRRTLDRRD